MHANEELSVLLVDDNPDDRALVARHLGKEFPQLRLTQVHDPEQLEEALAAGGFELVITDYDLRWNNGLQVFLKIRERYPDCPVIMFTGSGNEEISVEAMKSGLDDYIVKKPAHFVRLRGAARRALSERRQRGLLRKARGHLQHVLASAPIVIYACTVPEDPSLGASPTYVSDSLTRVFGYRIKECLGNARWWRDQVHPEDLQRATAVAAGLLGGESQGAVHEYRFRDKDGHYRWVRDEVRVIAGENGRPAELVGAWTDITESISLQDSLLREQLRFGTLLEAAQDIIYTVDSEGVLLSISSSHRALTGLSREDLLNRPYLDMLHQEDRSLAQAHLAELEAGGVPPLCEVRLRKAEGWLPVELVHAPLREGQKLVGVIGIARDVTMRRETEGKLHEQSEILRSVLQNMGAGLVVTDSTGRLTLFNPEAEAILGLKKTKPPIAEWPRTFHLFKPGANQPFSSEELPMVRALRGESCDDVEMLLHGRSAPSLMSVTSRPLLNPHGQVIGGVSVLRDITRARLQTEQLIESQAQLRQALEELSRTREVVSRHERLTAMGEMAAGIAHDFNNSIVPLLGYAELLLDRPENTNDPDQLKEYLTIMHTAARDSAEVVRRLREFYRERDSAEVFERLDPNKLLEEVRSLTEPRWKQMAQAEGREIRMTLELGETPQIWGNAGQLRDALANLVFNAVDAIRRKGSITMRTRLEEDDKVLIEVVDTGEGMRPEVTSRCFQPFFSTKSGAGTGLGLSIVYGTVQRHQGEIHVESEPRRGSKFTILLPVAPLGRESTDSKPAVEVPRRRNILFVDDNERVRALIADYLAVDGHSVEVAANGASALKLFTSQPFDLVITDQAMPAMTGEELAARVKKSSPGTPVILLSGFGDFLQPDPQKAEFVDLVLSKPVSLTTLRDALLAVTRS